MPTVFTINGFRGFFYSNDHEPIHVHIEGKGGSAKVIVPPEGAVWVESSKRFSPSDLKKIVELVEEAREDIIQAWLEHFNDR